MDHYYQNIYFKKRRFKTSAIFKEDNLNLTIFEDEAAWNVNLSRAEIIKQAQDGDCNSYYDKLRMFLRSCPEEVEFSFMDGELKINLLLKNKMKRPFFTTVLTQVDFGENMFQLVDRLYNDKTQYSEKLDNLEKQHKILQTDNINLKEKLDRFSERKKAEEEKLYSKFVIVLNEKKQHIQHLNDLLIAFKKGRSTINPSLNNVAKNNVRARKNVATKKITNTTVSESEDSSGSDNYNTDNDETDNIAGARDASRVVTRTSSPGPTTSKTKSSFIDDSPATSFAFSKRIRTDRNLSSSDQLLDKLNEESNIHEPKIANDSNTATNEISPTVNFNTQELLDNL